MKELQRELYGCLTQASPQDKRGPAKLLSRSQRHSQGLEEENQALERKQDRWSWLGERRTCPRRRSGFRRQQSPSLHAQACTSPPPLALHNPILMSGSTTPWKASSCSTSLGTWRTRCGDDMPLHRKKRNQGSRSGLRWMRSWELNQTCLQTLLTSWLRGLCLSKRMLLVWLPGCLHLPKPSVKPCPIQGSTAQSSSIVSCSWSHSQSWVEPERERPDLVRYPTAPNCCHSLKRGSPGKGLTSIPTILVC